MTCPLCAAPCSRVGQCSSCDYAATPDPSQHAAALLAAIAADEVRATWRHAGSRFESWCE
jgi:hypothetical protein